MLNKVKTAEIRRPTLDDVIDLAPRLREADKLELYRMSHLDPQTALEASFNASPFCLCGVGDGRVECMFGVGTNSPLSNVGRPWFLTTEVTIHNADIFKAHTPRVVEMMKEGYDYLENWVDSENVVAVYWLQKHGFTMADKPQPCGPEGHPFYHFYWRRN